ncbi:hypothetical protein [Mesorhizobium sp. M1365]|uniref:hypothetical protein n=1 Tax=Mesorhizobium sp. M1365 TaxID=2957090 RepID=UPI0033387527
MTAQKRYALQAGGRRHSRIAPLLWRKGAARCGRDLTDIAIPRCHLSRMCEDGLLVNVGYGRYRAAALRPDLQAALNSL